MLVEIFYLLTILVRRAEASCVGNVADGSASLRYSFYDASQVLVVRTASIFSIELHVFHVLFGVLHSSYGTLDNLLRSGVELVADVALARTDARMYAFVLSIFQGFGSTIDVLLDRAGQGTNRGPRNSLTDFNHAIEVARTTDGETCLDNIHAKGFELLGDLNLLYSIELASRHLFAIAKCRVENKQFVTHISYLLELRVQRYE